MNPSNKYSAHMTFGYSHEVCNDFQWKSPPKSNKSEKQFLFQGHKTFCQFRERCQCAGCQLIRFNQQVSKTQVRLRRQKDVEAEMVHMVSSNMDGDLGRLNAIRRNPMCFKCWVHDSVRVRLRGHRNVCPYARCACANCSLNSDRRRVARELRQFIGDPGEVSERPVSGHGPGNLRSLLPASAGYSGDGAQEHQHHVNTALLLPLSVNPMPNQTSLGTATPLSTYKTLGWPHSTFSPPLTNTPSLQQGSPRSITVTGNLTSVPYPVGPPFAGSAVTAQSPHTSMSQFNRWIPDQPPSPYPTVITRSSIANTRLTDNSDSTKSIGDNYNGFGIGEGANGIGGNMTGREEWGPVAQGPGYQTLSTVRDSWRVECDLHDKPSH